MVDYVIQRGDTLSKIAKQFGVTVKKLQELNGIKDANLIFAGKTLKTGVESSEDFNIKGLCVEREQTVVSETSNNQNVNNTKTKDVQNSNADEQPPKALEGETNEHLDYWKNAEKQETTMVCRDESGKTADISGKLEITASDKYEFNPEAFTITDSSSGDDHAFRYKKVGTDDSGNLIYKCVSMNGRVTTTENNYTLEWKEDGTPELVQHEKQDNFGIGLSFEAVKRNEEAVLSEKNSEAPKSVANQSAAVATGQEAQVAEEPQKPESKLTPEQQQLVKLGIPESVIAQGDEAIMKYAKEHNIKLPERRQSGKSNGNLTPEQQQLVKLGIPESVIAQGDEAIMKYAKEHNIKLPERRR